MFLREVDYFFYILAQLLDRDSRSYVFLILYASNLLSYFIFFFSFSRNEVKERERKKEEKV